MLKENEDEIYNPTREDVIRDYAFKADAKGDVGLKSRVGQLSLTSVPSQGLPKEELK
jgi:hypothetical protein